MKRDKLKNICLDYKQELYSQFDILKEKYPYLFKHDDLLENFSNTTISLLKNILNNINLPTNIKNILLQILEEKAKDPIVIGITGTVGKTSTAYILTEYLKALGKKVTLLSSASIDVPISIMAKNVCVPIPIQSTNFLKNFLQLSLDYNSDYIIIEVSEEALRDNRLNGIPFDIKVLTHFWHNWMEGTITNEEYFENKSSFFTNEDNVKYFYHVSSENLQSFLLKANNPILYGSKFNANGIPAEAITYRIKEFFATLKKQYIEIQTPTDIITLRTESIYNSAAVQNVCGIVSILDYLNILNEKLLEETLNNTKVPGRKIIHANNRTIVITLNYLNDIHLFKELLNNEINPNALDIIGEDFTNTYNKIVVVDGLTGWSPIWDGVATSEEAFFTDLTNNTNTYFNSKSTAFDIVDKYYITNVNPGSCNNKKLLDYIEDTLKSSGKPIIRMPHRKECLRQVLLDSEPGDIIFISGRASFDIYQDNDDTLFFTDEEVIKAFLERLKWQ